MATEKKNGTSRIMETAKAGASTFAPYVQLALTIVIGMLGYFLNTKLEEVKTLQEDVVVLREFMIETQGNRFTSGDGLKLTERLIDIQAEMARVEAKIPKAVPPAWLMDRMDRRDESINKRLEQIEVRMDSIATSLRHTYKVAYPKSGESGETK